MGSIRSLFRRLRSKRTPVASPSTPASPSSSTTTPTATMEEDLERVFGKFDTNGDGKISSSELAAIFESLGHPVSEEELDRMMQAADSDGDGFISLTEFIDLNVDAADPLEDLRHAFQVYDLDRNGCISAEELARVMRGIGEKATVAECKRMIESVDRDGDGMVSFEEFRVMMTGSAGNKI